MLQTGCALEVRDTVSLANTIQRLISNDTERKTLGENAFEFSERGKIGLEKMTKDILDIM